ncbi:L-fucose/L-arabinose isomerase family protein [Stackebrandtia nassauensis]|uniref:L-arabinose isomerase n=1 Tax=Stackebrandtia nassauensis (strain DSM 44728 / CIP 108903 / NRRL B-16338 / NBRC 102104 / LLR-40K-21) TaxID=446470 RepID=D3Q981_STANL|nr:L-arabinose isomerase [Stackebrandtia nassauensis DSM 44728]
MQDLYDHMIPGITERQGRYAADIAHRLSEHADFEVAPPVKDRADAESAMRRFADSDLDGVLVTMLTYGPAMRVARLFNENRMPVCLANIQPEAAVTPAWDMADMTYNQGIHGAQDTANAMVRAGRRFAVITEDWRSADFAVRFDRWARAASAVTAWRSLKIGVFGYAMNDMGDIRVDENALLRTLGPEISAIAPGELWRGMRAVTDEAIAALRAFEDERFEIDPKLSDEERDDHARMQLAIESILVDGGYAAYSTHFDAIGEDGRFDRLPLAAASSLMAAGYGYGAEGDAMAAAMVHAGHQLIGDGHFTEMYAMDFPSESILMSHMGEGNWRIARDDEPVRLIKRPLGIGKLADPPTFLFRYQPGPATLASLVSLGGNRFRLVVSEGEVLDGQVLPALEMPYGQFAPTSGLRACMDGWLRAGGTHHQVMNLGHRSRDWEAFAELADIDIVHV